MPMRISGHTQLWCWAPIAGPANRGHEVGRGLTALLPPQQVLLRTELRDLLAEVLHVARQLSLALQLALAAALRAEAVRLDALVVAGRAPALVAVVVHLHRTQHT